MCFTKLISPFKRLYKNNKSMTTKDESIQSANVASKTTNDMTYMDVKSVVAVFERLYYKIQDPEVPESWKEDIIEAAIEAWEDWARQVFLILGVEDGLKLEKNELVEIRSYLRGKFEYAEKKYSKYYAKLEQLQKKLNNTI